MKWDQFFRQKKIEEEDARLASIWVDSDDELEVVIEKYGSEEYKKYYKEAIARKKRLWEEKGIKI